MYDAKKKETKDNKKLKYECVSTRSYFESQHNCNMLNINTSSVPIDNIFY